MLQLTRINQQPILVNLQSIAYLESDPDTLVTLTNGERLRVRETVGEVADAAMRFWRRVHSGCLTVVDGETR